MCGYATGHYFYCGYFLLSYLLCLHGQVLMIVLLITCYLPNLC